VRERVRAVDERRDALGARHGADLRDREHLSGDVGMWQSIRSFVRGVMALA
jgi:hypothetical protein